MMALLTILESDGADLHVPDVVLAGWRAMECEKDQSGGEVGWPPSSCERIGKMLIEAEAQEVDGRAAKLATGLLACSRDNVWACHC